MTALYIALCAMREYFGETGKPARDAVLAAIEGEVGENILCG
jgi:hypothetical protein